jgi:tripartite-type tricarboxylate transporter receptor subunit TctC
MLKVAGGPNQMSRRRAARVGGPLVLAMVLLVLGLGARALAQGFLVKPVRIIVPFAAGGAVDDLARIIGAKLGVALRAPVLVENHAGAGGNLGADVVAKSAPDGHTILQTTNGQAISPSLYRSLPFDPVRDFVPVTQLVASTLVLVAAPGLPVASTAELIALAKSRPGKLNYGSSGVGNPLHLTMEMIKIAAGIEIQPVPYRGDAQINSALMAGEVEVAVVPLASSLPLIAAGRLRALGVTSARRSAALPDVPTIAETGVPGFASSSWQGLFVAARTPRDIVDLIQRETAKVLRAPDMGERLAALAYEPVGSTPQDFEAYFKSELVRFAGVVKQAHIPPQD